MPEQKPQQRPSMEIPVNAELLFKYLGEAEYKLKLLEQTIFRQNGMIENLRKEIDELKNPPKETKNDKK